MLGYTRRPLVMNVVARHLRRDTLAQPQLSQAEQDIRRVAPNVYVRSEYKCEFCGYHEDANAIRDASLSSGAPRMKSHLDIIPLDGDITNTSMENLGVACAFCGPVLGLNCLPSEQNWHVAWLPGFEQSWISLLSASLMFADQVIQQYEAQVDDGAFHGGPTMKNYGKVLSVMRAGLKNEIRGAVGVAKAKLGIDGIRDFAAALERLGIESSAYFQRRDQYLAGFMLVPEGLVSNSWRGFSNSLPAITTGGSFAGIRSLLDLAALGKQCFLTALAEGWPPPVVSTV